MTRLVKTVNVMLFGPRVLSVSVKTAHCLYLRFHEKVIKNTIFIDFSDLIVTSFEQNSGLLTKSVFISKSLSKTRSNRAISDNSVF